MAHPDRISPLRGETLRFPVIRHVLAIVDDVEGGQAVAGIAPIPLARSAGLGSGRGSRARMLATRSAGDVAFIGVGVVCRMEYRAGHAWEQHDRRAAVRPREAIRALPTIAVRDRDF